jgi:Zinc finger, C3HC4 type (RING finger)
MNLNTFSKYYISYLLFNIGGWIYFSYLLYYTSYITNETCNSDTKELIDVIIIFVGISMALTTINVAGATSSILCHGDNDDDALGIENLYCLLITTFLTLSISGIISFAVFGITSGMTDIRCSNTNAEFGLKLSVYGVIWIAFIELILIFFSILLCLYDIIENAKLHHLCIYCFNICKKYKQRRVGVAVAAAESAKSSIPKYDSSDIRIPMPVATYKEDTKIICSVCYDAAITLLLEPCNHICICHVCYDLLVKKECPICKTEISATKKVYFASPGR